MGCIEQSEIDKNNSQGKLNLIRELGKFVVKWW